MSEGEEVPSPCTRVCTIDEHTGLCAGCYRTLDEISRWRELTNAQRRQVLAQLALRRAHASDAG